MRTGTFLAPKSPADPLAKAFGGGWGWGLAHAKEF